MTIEVAPGTAEPAITAKPKSEFQIMFEALRAKQTPWERNYYAVMANPEQHLEQIGREQLAGVGLEFAPLGNGKAGREAYSADPDLGHPSPKRLVNSVTVPVAPSVEAAVAHATSEVAPHHPRQNKIHHPHHVSVRESLAECVRTQRVATAAVT